MLLQLALSNGTRLKFAEGPFVDDVGVAGVVEETRSNPRLCDNVPSDLPSDGIPRPKG